MSKKPRRRTDYWDDPHAPKPTSRKPSASVVVRNHRGELLLLRRAGSGLWTIPTGALKKKETLTACAIRECREETGLAVELTGLAGVFSDPRHRIAYPDGEVRVPVNVCFYGHPVGGELATDAESDDAAWVAPEDLDGYDMSPAIRRRITHALSGPVPHVDLTAAGRAGPDGPGPACRRSRCRASVAAGIGAEGSGGTGKPGCGGFPGSPRNRAGFLVRQARRGMRGRCRALSPVISAAGWVCLGRTWGSGVKTWNRAVVFGAGGFRVFPQCVFRMSLPCCLILV